MRRGEASGIAIHVRFLEGDESDEYIFDGVGGCGGVGGCVPTMAQELRVYDGFVKLCVSGQSLRLDLATNATQNR